MINFRKSAFGTGRLLVVILLGALLLIAYFNAASSMSAVIGVELGPEVVRSAKPGQIVTNRHTLTNTGTITEIFIVTAQSAQNWPVGLSANGLLSETTHLSLTVGSQMTVPILLRLSVPFDARAGIETTRITAASYLSPTVLAVITDTTIISDIIHLPIIRYRWPPLPNKPVIQEITDDEDGIYSVDWDELPTQLAISYTLQEAIDPGFTHHVREVCTTVQKTCPVQKQVAGSFYYRVRGINISGVGEWSDLQSADVLMRGGVIVKIYDRSNSLDFYTSQYLTSNGVSIDWTGDRGACNPGSTGQNFRDAVLRRINYFRAMAGIPADITFSEESNRKAQAAALMMSVNRRLSHDPSPDWTCYSTDGDEGAGSSNLFLGVYSWTAINGYMHDYGNSNYPVGHRRWILYPQTQIMGTGDIPASQGYPAANALRVFDDHMWEPRPFTREEFVAWPPPGYVPYPVVFPRWSFSYDNADFSGASVSMTSGGSSVSVDLAPTFAGYGENTLVWIPNGMNDGDNWPRPAGDTTYSVHVQNVLVNGEYLNFSYDVIIFDPAQ